jgi:hypothetical protein
MVLTGRFPLAHLVNRTSSALAASLAEIFHLGVVASPVVKDLASGTSLRFSADSHLVCVG